MAATKFFFAFINQAPIYAFQQNCKNRTSRLLQSENNEMSSQFLEITRPDIFPRFIAVKNASKSLQLQLVVFQILLWFC